MPAGFWIRITASTKNLSLSQFAPLSENLLRNTPPTLVPRLLPQLTRVFHISSLRQRQFLSVFAGDSSFARKSFGDFPWYNET